MISPCISWPSPWLGFKSQTFGITHIMPQPLHLIAHYTLLLLLGHFKGIMHFSPYVPAWLFSVGSLLQLINTINRMIINSWQTTCLMLIHNLMSLTDYPAISGQLENYSFIRLIQLSDTILTCAIEFPAIQLLSLHF